MDMPEFIGQILTQEESLPRHDRKINKINSLKKMKEEAE
jgi:hypothetical protein